MSSIPPGPRPRVPRRLRSAALAAAAALLAPAALAACGGSQDDADRLRVTMAFPPTQAMSPYGDDAVLLSRLSVTEGLTRLDEDGAAKPALATSWRSSDSAETWMFTLRKASFQDGGELRAEDVVRTLEHAQQAKPQPRVLSDAGEWQASAAGERTVRITSDRPDALLPQRLANPSLAVFSEAAYGRKGKVDPVGHATGPFTLTELEGTAAATLERNDEYWDGRAESSGVDVEFVAGGTARANALRSGETDIAEAVPVSQVSSLSEKQAREVPTARTNGIYLNTEKGALADPAMRAAVREAVDGGDLAKDIYEGHADPGVGLLGPGVRWADKLRDAPEGRAQPADAAEVRNSKTITLATYTNRAELPEIASAVQQQLKRAGFTVKQVVRDYAQVEADALAGGFDAFILPRNTLLDTGDPVSYLQSDFTCKGSFNIAQLCDAKVDAAISEAAGTADEKERHRSTMRAEARVLGTDAFVPLVHERFVQGVAEDVRGVALDPTERALVTAETRRR
ncbi:ABC transporter substrate-binding protein [Streptomyces xiaopingdaonensis]|uniref:ABC transporter substrate-binding protein n=1 Tax=Streptomyces xiaopingdaonensis TaxID=1565415 RepID=UPI00031450F5|nr:ABC transporter substrate-binding protein [Streptomyces xiaopingdaonensis]